MKLCRVGLTSEKVGGGGGGGALTQPAREANRAGSTRAWPRGAESLASNKQLTKYSNLALNLGRAILRVKLAFQKNHIHNSRMRG